MWWGSEFAPPAPGHDPLETMTQEEYRSEITLNERRKEVIRVDEEGFHYKGEFIADAGEAHRLMVAFLKQSTAQPEPEVPTDEEILALSHEHEVSYTMCDGHVIYPKQEGCDMRDDVLSFARAVLARWGK
jgi:hypothetical protein